MSAREKLRAFVEQLADDQVEGAWRLLEGADPVLATLLNAPEDDEPLTEDELEALEQARNDKALGYMIPLEEILDEVE